MSKLFNTIAEITGGLLIVASPLLLTLSVSLYLYLRYPSDNMLIAAILLSSAGLISGIVWARRIYRTKGSMRFLSEIMATPDIEDQNEREKKNKEDGNV